MLSKHDGIWFLVTDSNTCKIYNYDKKLHQLDLYKKVEHPENKLKDIDLTSDGPGSYHFGHSGSGTYSQPSDPKEIKINNFAREISEELNAGRNTQLYKKLIIVAPPHMNGLIASYLNKHVKDLLAHTIEKDLLHLEDRELLDFVKKHYPDIFHL